MGSKSGDFAQRGALEKAEHLIDRDKHVKPRN